jgi:ABC-type nitrate/sulfonate/bicarbonate transport system substrate-binding protein
MRTKLIFMVRKAPSSVRAQQIVIKGRSPWLLVLSLLFLLLSRSISGAAELPLSRVAHGAFSEKVVAGHLVGIQSARVMAQSLPWIAEDAGIFHKYNLDFQLVYIASSGMATAAILGGDAELAVTGGVGFVRAFVAGASDIVFVGAIKNVMTQSILAGAEIKRMEDLKGKKVGVSRIGSNTHYFTVQAMKRTGIDFVRDITFIQTGGEFESLAALSRGAIQAATLTAPADARAIAQGFHYVVYGPDLRIPYLATDFVARRSAIAKRPQVMGQFLKAMAEALKILHTDKAFVYKILGKYLRVEDKKTLDAAYSAEIKALEQRLAISPEAVQATLEEVAQIDPRALKFKVQDLVDRRYTDEMEKSGFFDKLWAEKK